MKYFKRNGFVALVSMLSLTAYAGDSLPLSVAVSETKEFIQVSGHGIDTSNVIQQERIIQGTVLEEGTNEPLVGVNVVVKGTTIGTTTDIDGKYSIKIPSDKAILVFSYIGQKTEEYSVKGLNFLNVIMKSDATMLSEVVVYTGYMTQKKADLTGSVAMANASDLKKNASANAMKSLQGKMAGVHITTNGGNPAEGTTVQILCLSWVMLILSGCADEDIIERNSPSFPQSVNTRSAGDGVYDILGYGYDITGPYLDTKSSRAIVFDTNKLLEKGLITPYKLEESRFRYSSGKDVIDFTTNMSSSLQMSTPGILKVIGGASLNIAFGGNSHYNSDYSFAYCTQQYIDSRYRISEADINVLKTCLTKQFIERLSTYTPEQIVEEYGTHVLKDIYLGAKFEVYYMAKSTSSSKKESINAGLGASLFSLFKMDGKFQYDESLAITNKEQSLYYFTIGGDPAVGVQGSLNPENSPSIDIGKWMASVKSSTPKFIDVDNNSQSFIPIYELVTDPTKKQTLKAYIDNYIKSKEVCSISLYPSTTGTRQVSGLGHINQGAGVAIGDIDKNGRPDMILMGIDNPKGKNNFWYKVLYDIDENGYYSKESSILSISAEGWENSGGDIALCDLNNNGILDMVLLCTDKPTTAGRAYRWYYVAYDLKPDGHYNSLSSLNTMRELGFFYDGAGIDICDINKNGTPDLLMMVYDAPEGENSFRYQIAFDLQSNGNYLSLSPVYEVPGLGHDGDGAGVAVGDIDNNGTLDILFMALDAPSGKDKFVYEILPDIDKYGNSYAKPIYTPRFPDSLSPCDTGQGAACCLYDLDNNGFLDAIFVAIENIKGKSNSWKYVTGHNLNKQGVPMCWR